jgi:polyphosphate kinase
VVRGMCSLRPGVAGVSDNIRVSSVIGRFLEHSRLFWFANGGDPEVFLGSADWMPRNLDRRVEAVTPIDAPELKQQLEELLDLYLEDKAGTWTMQDDGNYRRKHMKDRPAHAQNILMEHYRQH